MVPNHRPTLTVHNPVLLFFAALSATVHPPTSILESERDGCGDRSVALPTWAMPSPYNLGLGPVRTASFECPCVGFPGLVSGPRITTPHSGSPTLLLLQPLNTKDSTHVPPCQLSLTVHHPVISAAHLGRATRSVATSRRLPHLWLVDCFARRHMGRPRHWRTVLASGFSKSSGLDKCSVCKQLSIYLGGFSLLRSSKNVAAQASLLTSIGHW